MRRRKRIKKTNPYDNSALSLESCTPPLFAVMQRQRWLPEQLPGGRLRW